MFVLYTKMVAGSAITLHIGDIIISPSGVYGVEKTKELDVLFFGYKILA